MGKTNVLEYPPSNRRQDSVDIIKGWAMLTIIIFHCYATCFPGLLGNFIGNPWNVPIFFVVGGFFLRVESMGKPIQFLKGKFKRLYLPATIIYGLNVLLHNLYVHIGWYPIGESHPASGQPFALYDIKKMAVELVKVLAAGGSGELAMGAMWFIYSLLYAFVGMTIIYWLLSWVCKSMESRFQWMTVVLFALALVSCILSQNYGLTVSRFSISVTAMFLIWWGMIINKKWQWQYDQWWGLALAIIVFVHCVMMHKGRMVLALNQYQDLAMLLVGSTAAIYIWGFIGKKIEKTFIGRFLSILGRESLYLMAFHITGFFICNSILLKAGVFSIGDEKGLYTYRLGNNPILLITYVCFAIATSFAILYVYRSLKRLFVERIVSR